LTTSTCSIPFENAQRILFEHLIVNAGFEISWWAVEESEWIKANIAAVFCDYTKLEQVFDRCIGQPIGEWSCPALVDIGLSTYPALQAFGWSRDGWVWCGLWTANGNVLIFHAAPEGRPWRACRKPSFTSKAACQRLNVRFFRFLNRSIAAPRSALIKLRPL
jgi:hypothetical protein